MDRTMLWKAEEREASEKLYKKLEGLTMIYPCSETMKNLLNDSMFLKPNPQAFFSVMHYLFWMLDPSEFKKRFYWPITDKRAEASFRSATIEYLKHLNEKHQLHWNTCIKSYLVVMPGGMKFINFMLEFVGFVVHEMTQLRKRQLSGLLSGETEFVEMSQSNLLRMRRQNAFLKEYAAGYIEEIDAQTSLLRKRTEEVSLRLSKMNQTIGIEVDELTDDAFIASFEDSNRKLIQLKLIEPANKIRSLEAPLLELKNALDQFSKMEKDMNYDRDQVKETLNLIRQEYPTHMPPLASTGNDINMNTLFAAFNCIHETIENGLTSGEEQFPHIPIFKDHLLAQKVKVDEAMLIVAKIQQKLNFIKKVKDRRGFKTPLRGIHAPTSTSCENNSALMNVLLQKCIYTPPIKLDMQGNGCRINTRLALLEDDSAKMLDPPLLVTGSASRSVRPKNVPLQAHNANQSSSDVNTTTNRSGIIDAMQLLRTIKKDSTVRFKTNCSVVQSQQNLSLLGAKWKERECLLGDTNEIVAVTPKKKQTSNKIPICTAVPEIKTTMANISSPPSTSPFTPFNSNESTRIARQQLLENSISGGGNVVNTSQLLDRKLLAVRKVQDDTLNLHNLSTSPSGRLGALISDVDLPKVQVNDITLDTDILEVTEVLQQAMDALKIRSNSKDNMENNANFANQIQPRLLFSGLAEEDALANISDSVLSDITM